jgi:hypothetical protein
MKAEIELAIKTLAEIATNAGIGLPVRRKARAAKRRLQAATSTLINQPNPNDPNSPGIAQKRYMLFYDNGESEGGWYHFAGWFDTIDEAERHAGIERDEDGDIDEQPDWWNIVDTQTWSRVMENA